uniref:Str_synth domain-containing protein n=1 Tax=Globodera pallida TaxID=36090 RepID=A0A183CHN0_GLOPA
MSLSLLLMTLGCLAPLCVYGRGTSKMPPKSGDPCMPVLPTPLQKLSEEEKSCLFTIYTMSKLFEHKKVQKALAKQSCDSDDSSEPDIWLNRHKSNGWCELNMERINSEYGPVVMHAHGSIGSINGARLFVKTTHNGIWIAIYQPDCQDESGEKDRNEVIGDTIKRVRHFVELLVSSSKLVDGKKMLFPDDLDFPDNDTIVFSDASTRFGLPDFLLAFMEHADDARIIEYKFSTGQLRVLVDGLNFANGVQIHPDRQSVLFCESASSRIQRYYYAGPKKGRQVIFVDNLPGFPDNIRLSASRQSFYVALFGHRSKDSPDWFDLLGPWPMARKFLGELIKLLPDSLRPYVYSLAPYGIVLEIGLNGNIVRSYHDSEGTVIQRISQVCDDGGAYLYLASFENNYIGRISKTFA